MCVVLPYKEVQDYCPRVSQRGHSLSHAASSVTATCGTCHLQPRTPRVSTTALYGGIITSKRSSEVKEEVVVVLVVAGAERGAGDEMQNKGEMEIQSDTMQERRKAKQSRGKSQRERERRRKVSEGGTAEE